MSVTIRKASSDDLGIIHDIRLDAVLGISDDFGAMERQAWADRRSPEFFAERVSRLESDIVKRGHECAALDSSPNAVGFYVKLGYAPMAPLNDDGAVPMRKALRVPGPRAGAS
jgi:hypothetical protein